MPGTSGVEVARVIRSEPALRDLVLLAPVGVAPDPEGDLRTLFDARVVKPGSMPTLEETLCRVLRRSRPTEAPALLRETTSAAA